MLPPVSRQNIAIGCERPIKSCPAHAGTQFYSEEAGLRTEQHLAPGY